MQKVCNYHDAADVAMADMSHTWLSHPCLCQFRQVDVQGHMSSPFCCTFDPVSRMMGLAGLAAGNADSVCLTLWQLTEGGAAALIGQHGQPLKQGFFSKPKQPLQPRSLSLDIQARICLVAVPGSQLHLFRWQARLCGSCSTFCDMAT